MRLPLLLITFLLAVTSALGTAVTQKDAPWGLQRISKPERITRDHRTLDFTFTYNATAGAGVDIYVLDTGVLVSHSDFEGRARFGASFVTSPGTSDVNGHGTHIAAIAAGKRFGVAKKASIISVKVVEDNGVRTTASLTAGLNWVLEEAQKTGRPSVVLMKIADEENRDLERAVSVLMQKWVHVVVAAGDDDTFVWNTPTSLTPIKLVGAMTPQDSRAPFSNWGGLVDMFAPGVDIISAGITSNTATSIKSGTCQAAAHVAGIIAYIIGKEGNIYSPAYVMEGRLQRDIQRDVLDGIPNGTRNFMAQLGPLGVPSTT